MPITVREVLEVLVRADLDAEFIAKDDGGHVEVREIRTNPDGRIVAVLGGWTRD